MILPAFLQPGDKIAMVSAAGKIQRDPVEKARHLMEEKGFVVEFGTHIFDDFHMFAGTDCDRAFDMQQTLDNPEIRAIFFTRGGYGSIRTLSLLDWSGFFKDPKWLIGFSDITVFHSFLTSHDVASIHGIMTSFFFENGLITASLDRLLSLLRGMPQEYEIQPNLLNRLGQASGILVGGNLSLLLSLRGTEIDLSLDGKVLFIEDIGEYDYHIDRMMMNFKYSGGLSKLSGLIVGYFTDTKTSVTPYGKTANEIIRDAVADYDFPVIFDFPAGHELPNFPLVMGNCISMKVTKETILVQQSF